MTDYPTEADAARLITLKLGLEPIRVTRFSTGSGHYVYEVVTADDERFVARMATNRRSLDGAVYWSKRLRPLGVPLPKMLGDDRDALLTPFPAIMIERLSGTDLGHVYSTLSGDQKRTLAAQIARIQQAVGELPLGPGYGFAFSYDDVLLPRWADVVDQSLERSRRRIAQVSHVDPQHIDRVQSLAKQFANYFARIPPQPFLDDTTTKNVLIAGGALSGIVDVDLVCFGDSLFTIALTQMALLSIGADLDYIQAWCNLLTLTDEQRAALQCYTCVFCLDFLSEIGQVANHNAATTIDQQQIAHLLVILDKLMRDV